MFESLRIQIARHTAACDEITALISRSLEERLSLKEKLRVWLHLQLCEFCDRFRIQMLYMRGLFSKSRKSSLSTGARERIAGLLREKIRTEERD